MKDRFFNQAPDIPASHSNSTRKGLAYRCYSTEAELEEMRAAQKNRGEAPAMTIVTEI